MTTQWKVANFQDPDLVPANIKSGVNIFGVDGTYSGGGSLPIWAVDNIVWILTPTIYKHHYRGWSSDAPMGTIVINRVYENATDIYVFNIHHRYIMEYGSSDNYISSSLIYCSIVKINKTSWVQEYLTSGYFDFWHIQVVWYDIAPINVIVIEDSWVIKIISWGNCPACNSGTWGKFYKYFSFDTNTDTWIHDWVTANWNTTLEKISSWSTLITLTADIWDPFEDTVLPSWTTYVTENITFSWKTYWAINHMYSSIVPGTWNDYQVIIHAWYLTIS